MRPGYAKESGRNRSHSLMRCLLGVALLCIAVAASGCAHQQAYKRGTKLSRQGQYDRAIEELEEAIALAEKGGKYEKFYALFEVIDTFFLTPALRTSKGPHIRDKIDSKRYMTTVLVALFPAILIGMYNIGYQASLAKGISTTIIDCVWTGFLVMLPRISKVIVKSARRQLEIPSATIRIPQTKAGAACRVAELHSAEFCFLAESAL